MNRAKLFFHIALAGILCPGVGLPLLWSLALVARFSAPPGDEAHARWTRRLFGLAVLDTVLVAILFGLVAGRGEMKTLGGPIAIAAPAPSRVIGVVFDPDAKDARVAEAREGYPAANA